MERNILKVKVEKENEKLSKIIPKIKKNGEREVKVGKRKQNQGPR